MNARISTITLPVSNLEASLTFYRDGLGFPADDVPELTPADDHIALELDGGLYLVLILQADFEKFSEFTNRPAAPPNTSSSVLSYFTSNREEVDEVLRQCVEYGGTLATAAANHPWGYAGYIQDPDGHPWEIMFNPVLNKD